jgi:transposase
MRILGRLSPAVQKQLVRVARKSDDPDTGLRFRAVAAVGGGRSRRSVAFLIGCAVSTVCNAVTRFLDGGIDALWDRRQGREPKITDEYLGLLRSVLDETPDAFGWHRPTWTRESLAQTMAEHGFPWVAPCTMGRALAAIDARRGRPKPSVRCPWPLWKQRKVLRSLRRLVDGATDEEPVLYADEVDIHLNPKVGLDWMNHGAQRELLTPGQNEKHYLAGALDATTGDLVWADGTRKTSGLFCTFLDRLVELYPHARCIHVIVDNYGIHSSRQVERHLRTLEGRVELHFLPPYSPDHNRIERVWQELHANVTRNHRCADMVGLLIRVVLFLIAYNGRKLIKPSLRRASTVAGGAVSGHRSAI